MKGRVFDPYRFARRLRDAQAITSGDPKRMARRAKNKVIGRLAARILSRLYR